MKELPIGANVIVQFNDNSDGFIVREKGTDSFLEIKEDHHQIFLKDVSFFNNGKMQGTVSGTRPFITDMVQFVYDSKKSIFYDMTRLPIERTKAALLSGKLGAFKHVL